MSAIKICDLRPAGSELFSDSESFMHDLDDRELVCIEGGWVGLVVKFTILVANKSSAKCAGILL